MAHPLEGLDSFEDRNGISEISSAERKAIIAATAFDEFKIQAESTIRGYTDAIEAAQREADEFAKLHPELTLTSVGNNVKLGMSTLSTAQKGGIGLGAAAVVSVTGAVAGEIEAGKVKGTREYAASASD